MALEYMDKMFKFHLDCTNVNPNHDMILLESMETITYSIPTLHRAPLLNVNLVWSVCNSKDFRLDPEAASGGKFFVRLWKMV